MTVIGWGSTAGGDASGRSVGLREARVRTVAQRDCRRAFHWHPITANMVCAALQDGRSASCFVS